MSGQTVKFHAFGDSFIVGDLDDFDQYKDSFSTRLEYLKYNVSFASKLAKELNFDFVNYAERGSGNFPQLDRLFLNILNGNIKEGDVVLFGITTVFRDRNSLIEFKKVSDYGYGPCMVDRETFINDSQAIAELDFLYTISILENLKTKFNLNLRAINIFDNVFSFSKGPVYKKFESPILISCGEKTGNTLVDILNDTWGTNQSHPYHTNLKVPKGYESLYTKYKHPSISGHEKISQWFLNNVYK